MGNENHDYVNNEFYVKNVNLKHQKLLGIATVLIRD